MAEHYSKLKFLAYPDHLKALNEKRVVAPIHVRIKPINHCNHDCWYCAYRVSNLQLGEKMDLKDRIPDEKMDEIVDDLIDMDVKAVTFSGGGEPLLYKQLPRHIETLSRAGIQVASLTNGANLQGRMAEAFAAYGTWVRISLDAWDDASYAKSRSLEDGCFTTLLKNLKDFSALKSSCVLGTSFIVTQENHSHLFDVCRALKECGVSHVKVASAVISNDGAENNLYHRSIAKTVGDEIERAHSLSGNGFSIINHYHETEERFTKEYTTCPYLQFLTVIGADCNVYTCQDKAYSDGGILGSISDRSFKEMWFSEETSQRMYAINPSKMCTHHCVTHAKNVVLSEILTLDPDHLAFV
jgi:sulfatase maturation enzyme AslB (radical SAM superfamily)